MGMNEKRVAQRITEEDHWVIPLEVDVLLSCVFVEIYHGKVVFDGANRNFRTLVSNIVGNILPLLYSYRG